MKRADFLVALAFLAVPLLAAENAPAPAPQPGSAKLFALVGSWTGQAELQETGKPSIKVKAKVDCAKAAGAWGVRCDATFTSSEMNILESDLFGYDAATGKVHWYSVTNGGEVHDHIGGWTGDSRLSARHTGGDLTEDITVDFNGAKAMSFEAVTTVAGAKASVMRGDLQKTR